MMELVQPPNRNTCVVAPLRGKDWHGVFHVAKRQIPVCLGPLGARRTLLEHAGLDLRVEQHQEVGARAVVVDGVPARVLAPCSKGRQSGDPAAVARAPEANAGGVQAQGRRHVLHEAYGPLRVQDRRGPVPDQGGGHPVLQDESGDTKEVEPLCHVGALVLPREDRSASARGNDHRDVPAVGVVLGHDKWHKLWRADSGDHPAGELGGVVVAAKAIYHPSRRLARAVR
mmetsp:Transcript_241/g.664  ORF Transcript_241/g.664 Transcript_241/m.664 type:complete len:228 (-) Transcript_241:349-1032(-)